MRSIEASLASLFLFFSVAFGGQDPPAGVRKQKPSVPRDLEFATEIVDTLQASGLEVFAVVPEKMPPFPGAEKRVLLLTNEKKMIDVFFFPSEDAADHITITYSRSSQPGKHHRYSIEGWPVAGGEVLDTFQPLYFTLQGRWLIQTGHPEIDALVKKALRQMGPAAEPARQPCPEPRLKP